MLETCHCPFHHLTPFSLHVDCIHGFIRIFISVKAQFSSGFKALWLDTQKSAGGKTDQQHTAAACSGRTAIPSNKGNTGNHSETGSSNGCLHVACCSELGFRWPPPTCTTESTALQSTVSMLQLSPESRHLSDNRASGQGIWCSTVLWRCCNCKSVHNIGAYITTIYNNMLQKKLIRAKESSFAEGLLNH